MTVTMIRHSVLNQEIAVVITCFGTTEFTATFQVYDKLNSGDSGYLKSSSPWSTEAKAIREYNAYCAEHKYDGIAEMANHPEMVAETNTID